MNSFYVQDAELAVLNILFNHPELAYSLQDLKSFMFSALAYQLLYTTVKEITEQGNIADSSMVSNYLSSSGKLKEAGGQETINYIKDLKYEPANLKEYENQIINSYKVRTVVTIATEVTKLDKFNNINEIINAVRVKFDNLLQSSGGNSTVSVGDIAKEVFDNIVTKIGAPGIPGNRFGIKGVDLATGGLNKGDVLIIASRPSMGKTACLCNSAIETGKAGNACLVFSLEMNKQQMMERFIALSSGISVSDLRMGLVTPPQVEQIKTILKEIKEYPIYLDCNFTPSLEYILATARKYKVTKNIKRIYIDYLQLLVERDENQTAELGYVSRAFKLLARELDIDVVLFSQLNRLVEMRPDKRPILSDLRQSGNLEEDADIVAFLYRDEYYNPMTKDKNVMEWIIRKNRNGGPGTVFLDFNPLTNKIEEQKKKHG